jgi:hypothetical protein
MDGCTLVRLYPQPKSNLMCCWATENLRTTICERSAKVDGHKPQNTTFSSHCLKSKLIMTNTDEQGNQLIHDYEVQTTNHSHSLSLLASCTKAVRATHIEEGLRNHRHPSPAPMNLDSTSCVGVGGLELLDSHDLLLGHRFQQHREGLLRRSGNSVERPLRVP